MAITKLNSLAIPDDTIVEADLSYPLTNFSSTGIDDNASSTAVTIDSAGRVGIGSSPDTNMMLHVHKSDTNRLYLTSTNNAIQIIGDPAATGMFIDNESDAASNISFRNTSSYSERMRILGTGDIGYSGKLFSSNSLTSAVGLQLYRDHATGSCYLFDTTTAPYYGPLIFGTGNAERMRVDVDGIVKLITANDTAGTTKRLTFGTNAFNRAEIRCTNAATYDGSLEFHTGNSSNYLERARIHASGTTTIGTTEASIYDSNGGSDVQNFYRLGVSGFSTNGKLSLGSNSDGGSISGARINSAGDHIISGLIQIVSTNNTAGSETGDIRFYTKPSGSAAYQNERMRILSSGGITFNGDTAAANALDDYEEGTWTPAITGTSGIPSVTYSHRSGYYIKIGNSVIARWGMRVGSISGGSGTLRITGLPYTAKNYGSYQQAACFSNTQGLTTDADGPVLFYAEDGQTTMQARLMNNSDTPLPLSYCQVGSWCIGTMIYDVT